MDKKIFTTYDKQKGKIEMPDVMKLQIFFWNNRHQVLFMIKKKLEAK